MHTHKAQEHRRCNPKKRFFNHRLQMATACDLQCWLGSSQPKVATRRADTNTTVIQLLAADLSHQTQLLLLLAAQPSSTAVIQPAAACAAAINAAAVAAAAAAAAAPT
jgi:hypothetical protein